MAAQAGAAGSQVVDLSQVSMPRLLFSLLHQRVTGTVTVDQPPPHPGRRTIWLRGGMAVFTDWAEPVEVLGQVLIGAQMISEQDLLEALEMMARQGGLLGQTLMVLGRIDENKLADGLSRQCARKVARLSGLSQGQAAVTVTEHPYNQGLRPVNMLEVIHSAVNMHWDEARVASEMGNATHALLKATPSFNKYVAHFRFRPADKAALQALVRGTQLSMMPPGVTPRRAAQLAYLLWACRMLQVGVAPTQQPAPHSPAPPSHAPPGFAPTAHARQSSPASTGDTAPPPGFAPTSLTPDYGAAATPQPPTSYPPAAPQQPPSYPPAAPQQPPSYPPGTAQQPSPQPTPVPRAPATQPKPQPTPVPRQPAAAQPRPPAASQPPTPAQAAKPKEKLPPIDVAATGIDPEFAKEIMALEDKVAEGADPFDLFGLSLEASRRDVRRAWSDLSRKFHPDVLASQGLEVLRERVGDLFAALSEAHQILADADEREKIARQVAAGEYGKPQTDATATARAAFEAELIAKEGEKLLRSNNYARALERFKVAAEVMSDPSTEASIIWCTYQLSNKGPHAASDANDRLKAIVEEYPNIAEPHYYRGFALVTLGHIDDAIDQFELAYQLDSRKIDAERQARALRLKKKAEREARNNPPPKKSGLRGLFGKK